MRFFLFACTVVAFGCGGAIDTSLLDGGSDASTGKDAGGSDSAPGKYAAGPDCQALYAQLQSEEPQAEQCCATCNSVQCTQQVDGLCCPLTVNNGDSPAVKTYEATLKAFRDAGCSTACPAIACAAKPTGLCLGNSQDGTCSQL